MASRFAVGLRRSVVASAAVVAVILLAASAFSAEAAQREFDFFMLALQWPATACRLHTCCGAIGAPGFTIRGLWPDYNDATSWPKCCGDVGHDESQVESLLPAIDKFWPSLSCDSPVLCNGEAGPLWAREWETHGTCASPVITNEFNYFITALFLYSKYNVTEVLDRAGFIPSNTLYSRRNILAAITDAFGAAPLLRCQLLSLQEVRLCFDKDLKPKNCPADSTSSCPLLIRLPRFVSPGIAEVTDGDDSA